MDENSDRESKSKEETASEPFKVLPVALNLGFSIAVPLVGFALLGRYLDHRFETSPWLLLLGIGLAIVISMVMVYQKVKEYLK